MFPRTSPDHGALPLSRRTLMTGGLATAAAASGLVGPATPAEAATTRTSSLFRWKGSGFTGSFAGTAASASGLHFVRSAILNAYTDTVTGRSFTHELAQWTGPVTATGFAATQLVASWNATTPVGSAARIKLRVRNQYGTWSRWFTMALWTSSTANSTTPTRTTYNGQSDAVARIATDTLIAQPGVTLTALQARVDLVRVKGSTVVPAMAQLCVAASTTPQSSTSVSTPGAGRGKALAVPAYSQMLHVGHYPAWNGGGEAWCSATSTAMILDYWKVGPSSTETAWVRPTPHTDPQVEQSVRGVWDAGYQGTGNWPFNTAYAHARGLSTFVTRLRSLAEAELFIAAGIPLAVSTSFSSSQLTGAGFSTNGHLMVLRGFTSAGNPMLNDPASSLKASNALVPKTYDRGQFESAWGRSGGLAYVMAPASHALPARIPGAAW